MIFPLNNTAQPTNQISKWYNTIKSHSPEEVIEKFEELKEENVGSFFHYSYNLIRLYWGLAGVIGGDASEMDNEIKKIYNSEDITVDELITKYVKLISLNEKEKGLTNWFYITKLEGILKNLKLNSKDEQKFLDNYQEILDSSKTIAEQWFKAGRGDKKAIRSNELLKKFHSYGIKKKIFLDRVNNVMIDEQHLKGFYSTNDYKPVNLELEQEEFLQSLLNNIKYNNTCENFFYGINEILPQVDEQLLRNWYNAKINMEAFVPIPSYTAYNEKKKHSKAIIELLNKNISNEHKNINSKDQEIIERIINHKFSNGEYSDGKGEFIRGRLGQLFDLNTRASIKISGYTETIQGDIKPEYLILLKEAINALFSEENNLFHYFSRTKRNIRAPRLNEENFNKNLEKSSGLTLEVIINSLYEKELKTYTGQMSSGLERQADKQVTKNANEWFIFKKGKKSEIITYNFFHELITKKNEKTLNDFAKEIIQEALLLKEEIVNKYCLGMTSESMDELGKGLVQFNNLKPHLKKYLEKINIFNWFKTEGKQITDIISSFDPKENYVALAKKLKEDLKLEGLIIDGFKGVITHDGGGIEEFPYYGTEEELKILLSDNIYNEAIKKSFEKAKLPTKTLTRMINIHNYSTIEIEKPKSLTRGEYQSLKNLLVIGEENGIPRLLTKEEISSIKNDEANINQIIQKGFNRTVVEGWYNIFEKQKHSKDFIKLLAGYQGKENLLLLKNQWAKQQLEMLKN